MNEHAASAPAVIFDVGNVLIRWDARLLYRQLLPDEAAIDAFFAEVGFHDWNLDFDRGAAWDEGVAALTARHPHRAPADRAPSTSAGTRRCRATVEGIAGGPGGAGGRPACRSTRSPTSPATKWAETRARFPFLAAAFRDVVVSGHEGVVKPDPAIYRRCLERNGLEAAGSVFVDDSAANVAGAAALGIDAIRFTDAPSLVAALGRGACRCQREAPDEAEAAVRGLGEAADLGDRHRRGEERRQRRGERRCDGARTLGAGSGPVSVMWKRKRSRT